jgi:hypothetical protein
LTFMPTSGFAYNQRPSSFSGSWQHMIFGTSQGSISLLFTRWDAGTKTRIDVGGADTILNDMAMEWQAFNLNIQYADSGFPDSCIIILSASGDTPTADDFLYLDDLAFNGSANGISDKEMPLNLRMYPNPANNIVTFNINNSLSNEIEIYDMMGNMVKSEMLDQNQHQFNVGELNNGLYVVSVKANGKSEIQKLMIQR